jgi:hypothetical protein
METSEAEKKATETSIVHPGSRSKKWIAVVLVLLCVVVSWVGVIDHKTEEYVDNAIVQALFAYGGARALNAGISLLQSAEIGAGIGVDASIQPFEVLDPVNDMVEDYATAMKYAIGSLMTQKLLVEILSTNAFKWLTMGAAALLMASLLLFHGLYSAPLLKGFLFVALVRFLFVITIMFCGLVDSAFVNDKTVDGIKRVEVASKAVAELEGSADLAPGKRDEINQKILELEMRRDDLIERIDVQLNNVSFVRESLEEEEKALNDIKAEMSVVQKLNILKRENNYSEAKQAKKEAAAAYKDQLNIQEGLEENLEEVNEKLADQQALLYGKKSLLSKAKSRISSTMDLANIGKIKSAVNDSIESMLMLISLFIFKTLIMPLVFLALILRAFKAVWGIDPRSLLGDLRAVTAEEAVPTTSAKKG